MGDVCVRAYVRVCVCVWGGHSLVLGQRTTLNVGPSNLLETSSLLLVWALSL